MGDRKKYLLVFGSEDTDIRKISNWLDTSDFYAEECVGGYWEFEEENVEELEAILDKEFVKNNISARFELAED